MDIYEYASLKDKKFEIIGRILKGDIFIYPTDTIYRIGCDATNYEAVNKIRKLKERPKQPFSIIVPSFEWIYSNCVITPEIEKWFEKLPGRYSFILKLKNPHAVASNVSFKDTISIRIPDNRIMGLLASTRKPVLSTSVNKTGEEFMTSIEDLNSEIMAGVDFMINSGKIEASPSKIIDLTKDDEKVIRE